MKATAEITQRQKYLEATQSLTDQHGEDQVQTAQYSLLGWLLGESDPPMDDEMDPPTTDEQLDKAIAVLQAERENIPEYSVFGYPNWKIIDAQVAELEWCK